MLALALMLSLTVVIDPGHGGSNTGAPGRVAGSREKQVTLEIARAVAARLEAEGVHVILTRDRDQYLTLRERSRRANEVHPDCFLSLHANASPDHDRRGIETYVLAREAGEVDAHRAREEAPGDVVAHLLAGLRQREAQKDSVALARAVQSQLVAARGVTEDRGVRQAAYDVLSGVEVPAV
ncbi:MAG: N-acetylmuramoyl-L-alanine amidase, partial [Polyangia bacterium]